ncbi:hypothetical protein C7W93_22945 [Glaciimonas sp. PCH181]|nr:hypothetical protein C7W93_22945 [Glaciimonas sp. PCH181]
MQTNLQRTDIAINQVRRWLFAITSSSICIALLYAWKLQNINVAGNLLLFWLWFISAAFIAVLFVPEELAKIPRCSKNFARFNLCISLLMTFAMVWFGHFLTAGFYMLGWCARSAGPKIAASQQVKKC